MSRADIQAVDQLRAAQGLVREASVVLDAMAFPQMHPAAEAREDALEYLAAAIKRMEDAIKALDAPPQKEPA